MRVYATPQELADWLGGTVDDSPSFITLLRSASLLVEQATRLAVYDVDADGFPTDPEVKEAFKAATLQQAATWHVAGVDPLKGETGQQSHISSQSVEGGSVSYSGTMTAQELGRAATELSALARGYLNVAGLLNRNVRYRR